MNEESKLETETEKQKQVHIKLLKESKELVGPLYPCIKEKGGKILSGIHRKEADPNWPEKEIEVKNAKHRLRVIVHSNIQRSISEAEKQSWIIQAREILQSEGKKGTQEEIAELLGFSQGWVSFYDPVEHQVHPPKKVLGRNTFSPPHKPESIPPKIELIELKPELPSKSAEELSKLMKERWGSQKEILPSGRVYKETKKDDGKPEDKKLDPSFCEYWKKIDKIREELKNIDTILLRRLNECTFPKGCPNCPVNHENCLKDQKLLNELSYRLNQLSCRPSEI